uniref:Uncharacterized protein n=1 Tax=Arundo donax TaxID=35708 RepID=A0A0A9F601_ARUDO
MAASTDSTASAAVAAASATVAVRWPAPPMAAEARQSRSQVNQWRVCCRSVLCCSELMVPSVVPIPQLVN